MWKIFQATNNIVSTNISGISCLIHWSDGWDRTSQLCALSQIQIDPYFRTLKVI